MTQLIEVSPVTGEQVASYEIASPEDVAAAMTRARRAFESWGSTTVAERMIPLRRVKELLIDELDETVAALVRSTGKVEIEALAADVVMCIDSIQYALKRSAAVLAPESRDRSIFSPLSTFHVEYMPLGVVAVISPWNYPLQLAFLPVITALAAGSCVVLKPSEVTPVAGALIASLCERAGFPRDVVQVVHGGPETGRALVAARPDKIFFTGSVATGKKIMAAAAEHLIPVELELGGKDPMIVFADANLERAVAGGIYGAFTNAGQTCVAVERVYVERSIYEEFLARATRETAKLRVGSGAAGEVGPIINPAQLEVIEAHVDDALAKGARLTTERKREGAFYWPLVMRDVDHTMKIMTEETFGPVLPVMPFDTEDEAVELANGTIYGLNASVWTSDLERGRRVASRLVTGSCAVNDVIKNIANPDLPFGGEKQSGLGRYHGPEGLRSFSRVKSVMVNDGKMRGDVAWFPYDSRGTKAMKALVQAVYGDKPALSKARSIIGGLLTPRSRG